MRLAFQLPVTFALKTAHGYILQNAQALIHGFHQKYKYRGVCAGPIPNSSQMP